MVQNLIFLHGFLGSSDDWQAVIKRLAHYHCYSFDLPFHGQNRQQIANFAQCAEWLSNTIHHLIGNQPYHLIGYSLGGRLAAYFATQTQFAHHYLQQVCLEGANLGLDTEQEKLQRWQNDTKWAARFATENIETVLEDWYQQAVFSDLTTLQRQQLIAIRKHNNGSDLAKMLSATSLAKQPNLWQQIQTHPQKFHYICGENDKKFKLLAEKHQLNLTLIAKVGHNAHIHQPAAFADCLTTLFDQ